MAYNHRKLISETLNISASELCPPFCDPTINDSAFCPTTCLSICPSICHYSPSSLIPPPFFSIPSSDHSEKSHKHHHFLVATLATLAATILLVCCYTIYVKFFLRRRSRPHPPPDDQITHEDHFLDENHGPVLDHPIWYIRTVGLQPSVISAITVCKFKRGDGLVEGTDCAVCLSEFEDGETLRLLPKCNHAFHIPCIDTWLGSHTNCPMCRAGIVLNTTGSPTPEQNVNNSGVLEETRERISEINDDLGREREDSICDLRIGTEEENQSRFEDGRGRYQISEEGVGQMQPVRRSASMDYIPDSSRSLGLDGAFPVDSDSENNSEKQEKASNLNLGSSSIERSLRNGQISMERSISCTGKFWSSRYSRSRNSVLPL